MNSPAPLIFPNWHVALIHFPIALVLTGTLIELFSFLWRRSSFRSAGRWMLLLGTLWLIPASLTGIVALGQAVHDVGGTAGPGAGWRAGLASHHLPPEGWRLLEWHAWLMGASAVLIGLAVLVWTSLSDAGRRAWGPACWIVHLLGVAALCFGTHLAGEANQYWLVMAPRAGPEVDAAINLPASRPLVPPKMDYPAVVSAVPPMQAHTLAAGCAIAMGLAAAAFAFRNVNVAVAVARVSTAPQSSDLAVGRPVVTPAEAAKVSPVGRFLLLASGMAMLTTLLGFWVLADDSDEWKPIGLLRQVMEPETRRRLAHVMSGGLLVLLPLLMIMLTRWAPRGRTILLLLTVLYVAAAAAQVVLGMLMNWDSAVGPFWFRV